MCRDPTLSRQPPEVHHLCPKSRGAKPHTSHTQPAQQQGTRSGRRALLLCLGAPPELSTDTGAQCWSGRHSCVRTRTHAHPHPRSNPPTPTLTPTLTSTNTHTHTDHAGHQAREALDLQGEFVEVGGVPGALRLQVAPLCGAQWAPHKSAWEGLGGQGRALIHQPGVHHAWAELAKCSDDASCLGRASQVLRRCIMPGQS